MSYYYQLIFLGNINDNSYNELQKCFLKRVKELGIDASCIKIIVANNFKLEYENRQPSFVFFLGGDVVNRDKDNALLEILLSNGEPIYPLFFGENGFAQEIPDLLSAMNGHRYLSENMDKFVNCALETLRLLRKTRKVFISYRRADSAAVADQLFDVLARRNFDVFLDSYVIRGADNFQHELFHRMSDCDVLVQLNTHDFTNGKWCRDEVEMANMKQIGIVEVIWPGMRLERWSELCCPCHLKAEDFRRKYYMNDKARLKLGILDKIASEVESVRARNLAARQDNIAGEFVKEAKKIGKTITKELYYLIEKLPNGKRRLYLPAVGIPSSYDYYESLEFRDLLKDDSLEIFLLYDELRIRSRWISHLDWLDSSLEVKSIKKKDFEAWLKHH